MTQLTKPTIDRPRVEKILTIGLITLSIILIVFFGIRAVRSFFLIQFKGLEQGVTDVELISGWMTIPYLAKAYSLPEEYIYEQINIPQEGNKHKSLRKLNSKYYNDEHKAILIVIQDSIKQYQSKHPPPTKVNSD